MKKAYTYKCKICGFPLVKAGKNDTGKQRYKCNKCNKRSVMKNDSKKKQNELKLFVKWLIDSTKIVDKIDMSRSTFNRKTRWCWEIVPKIKSEGIPSDFIFADATYLSGINMCLLIARNDKYVLNFKWAKKETYEDYLELFKPLDEPQFLICDGHKSISKAAKKTWKNIGIQRCLVHVVHDVERRLGKKSHSEINHIFRRHIAKITKVDTARKMKYWLNKFERLCTEHKNYIEEETLKIDPDTGEVIGSFRTHQKLFSVRNMINKLQKKNMLFLFLEHSIPNNSNYLEGGINSPLKNLKRCHRGISLEHEKRMWEWYLLSRSNLSINDFIKSLDLN